MERPGPLANPDGPQIPQGAAADAAVPHHIPAAPPVRCSRSPCGPVAASSSGGISSASALLELAAAYPMYTKQRCSLNHFVPDAQFLFHALGDCDQMMISTDCFLRSAPAWLPAVSQLYIAVLWNYMIILVYVTSGYGAQFTGLLQFMSTELQIQECMVPGPLFPFFQSLAAIDAPFDWLGDIVAGLPDFNTFWDAENFAPNASYARQVPVPALLLDQLFYFATWPIPADQAVYTHFPWYGNVFSLVNAQVNVRHRLGPQLCGSLYVARAQCDSARSYWNSTFTNNFTRVNAATNQTRFTDYKQLFGFVSQNGTLQLNWFRQICDVMRKYAQYMEGSVPLKSIPVTGLGACAVYGVPVMSQSARNWFYPDATHLTGFLPMRYSPLREIPDELAIRFHHADHEAEEQDEQYAVVSHTNIRWPGPLAVQHDHDPVLDEDTHSGDYWSLPPHHHSGNVSIKSLYAPKIASHYHQQSPNRVI